MQQILRKCFRGNSSGVQPVASLIIRVVSITMADLSRTPDCNGVNIGKYSNTINADGFG